MKLVDAGLMAEIDARAIGEYGIPGIVLMEHAALESYARMLETRPRPGRIVCLAGAGNNGGDALAIARLAAVDGYDVSVVLSGERVGELGAVHLASVKALGLSVAVWPDPEARDRMLHADTIVDGLFGTGFKPPLRPGSAVEIIETVNRAPGFVVSIDVPSGTGDGFRRGYPAVAADLTVCIALPKTSLFLPGTRVLCGEIQYVPAGFPPQLTDSPELCHEFIDRELALTAYPRSRPDAYKGSRGRVGIFAGSEGTTGAAVLAAESSAAVGSGLVYVNVDRDIYPIIASHLVSAMPGCLDPGFEIDSSLYDALIVGPGWGIREREALLRKLFASHIPGVLDADGLSLLARFGDIDLEDRWVLTPHPGELGRLLGIPVPEVLDEPYASIGSAVAKYRATVVFKSHVTIIGSPDGSIRVLDGMNPYLGTGGSGDCLAGCIAGCIARGADPFDAATAGCYIHAAAGNRAKARGWFSAHDLPAYIAGIAGELQEADSPPQRIHDGCVSQDRLQDDCV